MLSSGLESPGFGLHLEFLSEVWAGNHIPTEFSSSFTHPRNHSLLLSSFSWKILFSWKELCFFQMIFLQVVPGPV